MHITADIGYNRNSEFGLFHILTGKELRGPWVPVMSGDQNICYFSVWKEYRFIFLWKFGKMIETELQTLLMSCIDIRSKLTENRNVKFSVQVVIRRYLHNICYTKCFHSSA